MKIFTNMLAEIRGDSGAFLLQLAMFAFCIFASSIGIRIYGVLFARKADRDRVFRLNATDIGIRAFSALLTAVPLAIIVWVLIGAVFLVSGWIPPHSVYFTIGVAAYCVCYVVIVRGEIKQYLRELNKSTLPTRVLNRKRVLNVLLSNSGERFDDVFADWMRGSAPNGTHVNIVKPSTIEEAHLLRLARQSSFDLAVLTLNNIRYSARSGDVGADLRRNSINLVKTLKQELAIPVIAVFGSPGDSSYAAEVMIAGATAVLPLPGDRQRFQGAFEAVFANIARN